MSDPTNPFQDRSEVQRAVASEGSLSAAAERWLRDRGPYNSEATEALVQRLADAMRNGALLAAKLDERSEAAASKACDFATQRDAAELLARAACYQECAGLIREALK